MFWDRCRYLSWDARRRWSCLVKFSTSEFVKLVPVIFVLFFFSATRERSSWFATRISRILSSFRCFVSSNVWTCVLVLVLVLVFERCVRHNRGNDMEWSMSEWYSYTLKHGKEKVLKYSHFSLEHYVLFRKRSQNLLSFGFKLWCRAIQHSYHSNGMKTIHLYFSSGENIKQKWGEILFGCGAEIIGGKNESHSVHALFFSRIARSRYHTFKYKLCKWCFCHLT